jgi:hypothetical protein
MTTNIITFNTGGESGRPISLAQYHQICQYIPISNKYIYFRYKAEKNIAEKNIWPKNI